MACESEKKAFEDAKGRVKSLRQELEDLTGSDKPGGGVPSGSPMEGTFGSNEEVQRVREELQQALEILSHARVALSECTGQSVEY